MRSDKAMKVTPYLLRFVWAPPLSLTRTNFPFKDNRVDAIQPAASASQTIVYFDRSGINDARFA